MMTIIDRFLYWFLTRTPIEKVAILGGILGIIAVIGLIALSVLATLFGGLSTSEATVLLPLYLLVIAPSAYPVKTEERPLRVTETGNERQ